MQKAIARDGTPLTMDYCKCCKQKQPDGTLEVVGFVMTYCSACASLCMLYNTNATDPCRKPRVA